jgi:hypothetical protein
MLLGYAKPCPRKVVALPLINGCVPILRTAAGPLPCGSTRAARLLRVLLASAALCLAPAALPAAAAAARGRARDAEQAQSGGGGDAQGLWALLGIQGVFSEQQQQQEQQQQRRRRQGDKKGLSSREVDAFVDSMLAMWRPVLSNMGISGALGAVSAAALKVGAAPKRVATSIRAGETCQKTKRGSRAAGGTAATARAG